MTTHLRLTRISLILIGACASTLVLAQPGDGRGPMRFADLDRDGNGEVTPQELEQARAERRAARAAIGAPMGRGGGVPAFSDLDLDGDGRLTPDEFATAHGQLRPGGGGMGYPGMGPGGMGPGGMGGRGMGPGGGMRHPMPTFSDFDLNADGRLTEQEFYEARAQRIAERSQQGYRMRNLATAPEFTEVDANGDGQVDPAEFASAQARHRQQGMGPPAVPGTP